MSNVIAFQRVPGSSTKKPTMPRQSRRFAARLGWWALGAACAAPAAILAALRPFIVVAYWLGVFYGIGIALTGAWLAPHSHYSPWLLGGIVFFGAIILRHGSTGLLRLLLAGKLRCESRSQKNPDV